MEWTKIIIDLIKAVAWPSTVVFLAILFRREISSSFDKIKTAKFPGVELEMGREIEELARNSIDPKNKSILTLSADFTDKLPSTQPMSGATLVYAARRKLEEQMVKLAQASFSYQYESAKNIPEVLKKLESEKVITKSLNQKAMALLKVLDELSDQEQIPEKVIVEINGIASHLAAQMHYITISRRLRHDFESSLLWHFSPKMNELNKRDYNEKFHFWSAIAASAPDFDYSYEVFVEAAQIINEQNTKRESKKYSNIYIPTVAEYISILQFRLSELQRYMDEYNQQKSEKWIWPKEWGDISWNGPIVRFGGYNQAMFEHHRTTTAIDYYSKLKDNSAL
ncbi:MAG: hypothetical protein RRB13_12840 [bacterium]|nr:hypothetical protein [bacterium]